MLISRLSEIDHIYDLQEDFKNNHLIYPLNVSSWRVSDNFRNLMLRSIKPPDFGNVIDYFYTYSFSSETKDLLLNKLGVENGDAAAVICPNNTISIINAANLLRINNCNNICIVNPAYFSVQHVFNLMRLHYKIEEMTRESDGYHLPYERILTRPYDAVWITSPVFSTGVYLSQSEIEKIMELLDRGVLIIADESFALNGNELIRKIGVHPNFIGIYSPHKAIACNSFKFSVIVGDLKYQEVLHQWIDVLCGNLPQSTCSAVKHFISPNFDECYRTFIAAIQKAYQSIATLLQGHNHYTDSSALGSMITIYYNNICSKSIDDNFFFHLYEKTFAGLLPGYLNGFGPQYGLCFRINLALDSIEFRQAIFRLLPYLDGL